MLAPPRGEVEVSIHDIRRWNGDEESSLEGDSEDSEEERSGLEPTQENQENGPEGPEGNQEQEEVFEVEKILAHKKAGGWRFLTAWKGYALEEATWEPIRSFRFTRDNKELVNDTFVEYCTRNGLKEPLRGVRK